LRWDTAQERMQLTQALSHSLFSGNGVVLQPQIPASGLPFPTTPEVIFANWREAADLAGFQLSRRGPRVPTVLRRKECQRLFEAMAGTPRLMAELAGVWLPEALERKYPFTHGAIRVQSHPKATWMRHQGHLKACW
jgi:hypothetical protein